MPSPSSLCTLTNLSERIESNYRVSWLRFGLERARIRAMKTAYFPWIRHLVQWPLTRNWGDRTAKKRISAVSLRHRSREIPICTANNPSPNVSRVSPSIPWLLCGTRQSYQAHSFSCHAESSGSWHVCWPRNHPIHFTPLREVFNPFTSKFNKHILPTSFKRDVV